MARTRKQKRFTEQGIERLNFDPAVAPPSGRMEIEDEICPGLVLRVTQRGVKSFSVIYKVPGEGGSNLNGRLLVGKQHRITLGATPPLGLKEARVQARKILEAATEGRDPRQDQGEGRAQIVVEPKQELPFEIARGSRGGAAERGAGPTRAFIYRRRHETDSLSHFGRSVIEGRTDSEFSSPEVR
jgi:hypothetical protein